MPKSQHLSIDQAIDFAQREVNQGNIPKALELFKAVLQHQPNHPIAKEGLRKLQENLPDNVPVKVTSTNYPQDELNALINLFKLGQMRKVEQRCKELIQSYPQSAVVLNILGLTFQAQGRLKEAVQEYNKAIQLNSEYVEVYNNRGNALQKQGKLEEAVQSCNKAIQLKPDYIEAHYNCGIALQQQGKLEEAVQSFKKAIQFKPDLAVAYNNLGNTLQSQGKLEGAIQSYNKAIQLKPKEPESHFNRGNVLHKQRKFEEAVQAFDKVIELKTEYVEAYNNRGNILKNLGRIDEARASYEQAIMLKPDFTEAFYNSGRLDVETGELNKGVAKFKKALQIKPDFTEAYFNLSVITKHDKYDDTIRSMEILYGRKDITLKQREYLAFALGKGFEDLKEYNKSFKYILEGNRLKRKTYHYEIGIDIKKFKRLKEIFTPAFFSSHTKTRNSDKTPIFILGMPRSGTTLVEQILASHSKVHGAGEINDLFSLVWSIPKEMTVKEFPEYILDMNENTFEVLGKRYIERLRKYSDSKMFITDKYPPNFRLIGLIKIILPGAKVVHCMRDPMDNCLSIFKNNFATTNYFANNLKELGQYYNLYLDLMDHWRETIPDSIYDISYEALVLNQEEETRKLLTYCQLPWEESCLDFHKTDRLVVTASFSQVRRPMYSGSVSLWKKYKDQLKPLRDELDQ